MKKYRCPNCGSDFVTEDLSFNPFDPDSFYCEDCHYRSYPCDFEINEKE